MNKIIVMSFVTLGTSTFAFAGTRNHQDPPVLLLMLMAIVLPVLIYTANKWRLWGIGFKFGMAKKSTFISSVQWTIASVFVLVASVLILFVFG